MKITHASFVPTLVDNAGLDPANLPDLRYMSVGGEKITAKVVNTWSRSHVVLANAYGPTEATIGCCFKKVDELCNVRNIGLPLLSTTAHVLRPDSTQHVLRGVAGELCITGDLVAIGYYNRPDAKGFIDDFEDRRMYRTGDRVRMMSDGSLEFLGRKDDQTKIRGQRIELGEVSESVRIAASKTFETKKVEVVSLVLQHPSLARPQLVSFLVLSSLHHHKNRATPYVVVDEEASEIKDVIARCRSQLPSFMVPDRIITISRFPLASTSRKIDVRNLADFYRELQLGKQRRNSTRHESFGAKPTEAKVMKVLQKVLKLEHVDSDHNLFQLGLDSLSSIGLTMGLQRAGFRCSVSDILKNPTPRSIAKLAFSAHVASSSDSAFKTLCERMQHDFGIAHASGGDVDSVMPCLPLQETLIAASTESDGTQPYVNHVLVELSKTVNWQRLYDAWQTVSDQGQLLRTCFPELEGHYVQAVLRKSPVAIQQVACDQDDLIGPLERRRKREADDILAKLASRPPLRLCATSSCEGSPSYLQISIHHAIYDARTFEILMDKVWEIYRQPSKSVNLVPLDRVLSYIAAQDKAKSEAFWCYYLSNYQPHQFWWTSSPSSARSFKSQLSMRLTSLESLASSLNGTSASILQACFGLVLCRTLQKTDVVFGVILSGRTVPVADVQDVFGPCITTIPQRATVSKGANTVQEVVLAIQEAFKAALEYQHTALGSIHHWVRAEQMLFDSLFSYVRKSSSANSQDFWHVAYSSMSNDVPLAIEIEADPERDRLVVSVDSLLAEDTSNAEATIIRNLDDILTKLGSVKSDGQTWFKDLTSQSRLSTPTINGDRSDDVHAGDLEAIEIIRTVVAEITQIEVDQVSAKTSFFALGIDSILAIKLAKKLKESGMKCSSLDTLRHPSAEQLSRHLHQSGAAKPSKMTDRNSSPIDVEDLLLGPEDAIATTYDCTPLQASMLTNCLGSGGSLYANLQTFQFNITTNRPKFQQVWQSLMENTEILRTTFHVSKESDRWIAAVHSAPLLPLKQYRGTLTQEDFLFGEERDFGRLPWQLAVSDNGFTLGIHHSLYDGQSLATILSDLKLAYSDPSFAIPRSSYSSAANEVHHQEARDEAYWRKSLTGFEGISTSPNPRSSSREVRRQLDLDVNQILAQCRRHQITLQALTLLAFGKCFAREVRQSDVVIGQVVNGHDHIGPGDERIVGPLFNTLPFRINLADKDGSNLDILLRVQKASLDSRLHLHASLNKVQQQWRGNGSISGKALIDSLFVFNHEEAANLHADGEPWIATATETSRHPTEYSINMDVSQSHDALTVTLNSTRLESVDAFVDKFQQALQDILDHPDARCWSFEGLNCRPESAAPEHVAADNSDEAELSQPMESLREVLAHVAGVDVGQINAETNIFSLGLDSISAIRIASLCRKCQLDVRVADVLQGQTARGIENMIAERSVRNKPVTADQEHFSPDAQDKILSRAGIRNQDVEDIAPCTAGQFYHLRRWTSSGRSMGEATWVLRAKDRIDEVHLLESWRALRKRHRILRTLFVAHSSSNVAQVALKHEAVRSDNFRALNLNSLEASDAWSVAEFEAARSFDFFSPPCALVKMSFAKFDIILLRLHHVLYDAWTVSRLIADFNGLYETKAPASHVASTRDERLTDLSLMTAAGKEYWKEYLRGCQQTLPSSGKEFTVSYGFAIYDLCGLSRLEKWARRYCHNLSNMIIVAFARALARLSGKNDPVFGHVHAGRAGVSGTLHESTTPLMNVTPMIVRGAGDTSRGALYTQIARDLVAQIPHEQNSLQQIQELVGYGSRPLFNAFLNILSDAAKMDIETEERKFFTPSEHDWMDLPPHFTGVPGRTAIDGLALDAFAERSLFLDVQTISEGDLLKFVLRHDLDVVSKADADSFVKEVADELMAYVPS